MASSTSIALAGPLAIDSLDKEDAKFLSAFLDGSLPFEEWTHASHLRMATLQLLRHQVTSIKTGNAATIRSCLEQALSAVVRGIQDYNGKHADKLTVGFHWSITEVWLRVVALSMLQEIVKHDSLEVPANSAKLVADVAASSVQVQSTADIATGGAISHAVSSSSILWGLYSKATLFGADTRSRTRWIPPDVGEIQASSDCVAAFAAACSVLTSPAPIMAQTV
jgi:hypothetical protein